MDWENTGYSYNVDVLVVDQRNVEIILGSLSGVQLEGLTITENYYSDSRIQAKVSTIVGESESDGYIQNARLRIIMSIPLRAWTEELITGYVSDIDLTYQSGYAKRTYTIEGTLWGLLNHKIGKSLAIASGSTLRDVIVKQIMPQTRMQYSLSNFLDHRFNSAIVYEAGSNLSTVLFETTSGYDRVNNDGHGTIVISKYTAPSNMTPTKTLDFHDSRGLLMAPLSYNDTSYSAPGRAIVTTTVSKDKGDGKTEQVTISGYYDAPASDRTSIEQRGYIIARSDSWNRSGDNPSERDLAQEAKNNWQSAQDKGIEWTVDTVFGDYHTGEVINIIAATSKSEASSIHKVLISGVQTELANLTQKLTLKEV